MVFFKGKMKKKKPKERVRMGRKELGTLASSVPFSWGHIQDEKSQERASYCFSPCHMPETTQGEIGSLWGTMWGPPEGILGY